MSRSCITLLVLLVVVLVCCRFSTADVSTLGKSSEEILADHGYEYESLVVETREGYLLNLVRAINPLIKSQLKRPILFVHGMLEASPIYLYNSDDIRPRDYSSNASLANATVEQLSDFVGPDQKSMALLLVNAGYDVYLLSLRGTDYSQKHVNLTSDDSEFWNYVGEDLSLKDLPDTLKYIQTRTNATKIGYVGHSLGCTAILELLAEIPQYAELVEPVILLGPLNSIQTFYSPFVRPLYKIFGAIGHLVPDDIGYHGFPPPELRAFLGALCYRPKNIVAVGICRLIVEVVGGKSEFNSGTETFASVLPFQQSSKILSHVIQRLSGRWQKYDYGLLGNEREYGSPIPPEYNPAQIQSKSLIFYVGSTDSFIIQGDTRTLLSQLSVEPLQFNYISTPYNHFDYIGSRTSGVRVAIPVLQTLERSFSSARQ